MSRTMTRWTLAGALALGSLGTTLGFTPGVATADAAPSVSPFAGSWSGTWIGQDFNGQDSTLDWTVSDAGRLSGRVYHAEDGQGGEIRGHVRADGFVTMVNFAPSDDTSHGCGFPFHGTAVIDGDGKLDVSLTQSFSGGTSFVVIFKRN